MKPYEVAERGLVRTFQIAKMFRNINVLHSLLIGFHCRTRSGVLDAVFRIHTMKKEEADITYKVRRMMAFVDLEGKED